MSQGRPTTEIIPLLTPYAEGGRSFSVRKELLASIALLARQSVSPVAAQLIMALVRVFPTGVWFAKSDPDALIAASPINTAVYFYLSFTLLYTLQIPIAKAAELAKIAHDEGQPSEQQIEHERTVGSYFRQGLSISFLTALPLSGVAYFTGSYYRGGHTAGVVQIIDAYMHSFVQSGGLFPLLGVVPQRQLSAALKKPAVSTAITLTSAAALIAAFYAALTQKIGPAGFGYGLSLSTWIPFLGCLAYFACASAFKPFQLFSHCDWFDRAKWKQIAREGYPNLLSNTYECFVIAVLAGLMGKTSQDETEAALAAQAFSIAILCGRVVITPAWTGSNSLGALIKRAMTAETHSASGRGLEGARKKACSLFHGGLLIYGGFALSCGALFAWKPDYFSRLFLDASQLTPALHTKAQQTLSVIAVGGVCDVVRITGTGVEKALNRNGPSAKINALGLSLGLALAFIFEVCGAGPLLMLIGFYCGVTLAAALQVCDISRGMAAYGRDEASEESQSRFSLPCFNLGKAAPLRHGAGGEFSR